MKQIIVLLAISIAVFSCEMDIPDEVQPQENVSFIEIQVDEDFDFSNSKETDFTISSDQESTIYIYNGNPAEGGQRMYKAITKDATSINQTINIPVHLNTVWVKVIGQNGSQEEAEVEVNRGGGMILAFSGGSNNVGSPNLTQQQESCADCDRYLTNSDGNVTINSGDSESIICIASNSNYSGEVKLKKDGAQLIVCGQGTFDKIELKNANTVLVVNGVASVKNLDMKASTNRTVINTNGQITIEEEVEIEGAFENYGTCTIEDKLKTKNASSTIFENMGTTNVENDTEIKKNSTFDNYGTFVAEAKLDIEKGNGSNSPGTVNNYGTCTILNDFLLKGTYNNQQGGTTSVPDGKIEIDDNNALLNNYCSMSAKTVELKKGQVVNSGVFDTSEETKIENNGIITVVDGIWTTEKMTVKGLLIGGNYNSRVNVSGDSDLSDGNVSGEMTYCDQNGIESGSGNIQNSVSTDCNDPSPNVGCDGSDDDGDGASNGNDDFPDISGPTSSSFYPAENTFGTFMFEDLFPNKGDYDFNDFVTQYQFETITNASNQIVQLKARFIVQAVGAANVNGFGFTLENVSPNVIFSVEGLPYNTANSSSANIGGNGTEVNQNSATFIVFDNINNFMGLSPGARYNVYDNQTTAGNPGQVELTITFTQPLNSIGAAPFNPFIYVGQNRGKEIHLKGYSPSDLADYSYFNTGDDNTSFGNSLTYQTNNAHPWGLDIPSPIQHMEEGIDFVTGYTSFLEYAESNGSNNTDWYTNPVKRNSSVLRPSVQ